MSNFERNKKAIDDFFNSFAFKDKATVIEFFEALKPIEHSTRYVRHDVSVTLYGVFRIFNLRFGKDRSAKLLDISSQGVLIASHRKLEIGEKIALNCRFSSGREFTIQGAIVNKRGIPPVHHYGIKFNHDHSELGDYLLKTHNHYIFSKLSKIKNDDSN